MSISIIDGFSVNSTVPVDSRIVASNSSVRDNILYKYDGLQVFQLDTRINYIWNKLAATWSVNTGTLNGNGSANNIVKWTNSNTLSTSVLYNLNDNIGINTTNPLEVLQINSIITGGQPLVIHQSNNAAIGYNWYYTNQDNIFSSSVGSSRIDFINNNIIFNNKFAGSASNTFTQSFIITNNAVGINTINPLAAFQINSYQTNGSTPFVIDLSNTRDTITIGHNWYNLNDHDDTFNISNGSTKISQTSNSIQFFYRNPNTNGSIYSPSILLNGPTLKVFGDIGLTGYSSLNTILNIYTASITSTNFSVNSINTSLSAATASLAIARTYAYAIFNTVSQSGTSFTSTPSFGNFSQIGGFTLTSGSSTNLYVRINTIGLYKIDIYGTTVNPTTNARFTITTTSDNTASLAYGFGPSTMLPGCVGGQSQLLSFVYNVTSLTDIGVAISMNDTVSFTNVSVNGHILITRLN